MDVRDALIEETAAFGELIRGADPATPVPTCPEWTLQQLFRHVGRGNRWAAQIVADRRDTALDPREVRDGKPPDDRDAAIDWLNAGAALILDSVDDVGADTEVWTFIGPRPAQWWIRRRLHEATVHKADAAIALGIDVELAPEVAADGIDEWLERVAVETNAESSPLDAGPDSASACHRRRPRGRGRVDDHGHRGRRRVVSRTRQGRCRAARRREGSAARRRPPQERRRRWHRGFRRHRRLGRVAGPYAVLSGVRCEHDDFGDRNRPRLA